jgi:hypothetical protein
MVRANLYPESSAENGLCCCKAIMKRYAAIACAVLAALPTTANAGLFERLTTSSAHINSCSNVTTLFSYYFIDKLSEGYGFRGRGTFRIPGETDEAKQPAYNLVELGCSLKEDTTELECRLTEATVNASPDAPDASSPKCYLDIAISTFDMKEISRGILVGVADGGGSTGCFNTTLTINRNTKLVSISFERTQYADNYDRIKEDTCGRTPPRTQMLMNCTAWVPHYTNKTPAPGERICDFEEH